MNKTKIPVFLTMKKNSTEKEYIIKLNINKIESLKQLSIQILKKLSYPIKEKRNFLSKIYYEGNWVIMGRIQILYFFVSHCILNNEPIKIFLEERLSEYNRPEYLTYDMKSNEKI